MIPEKLTLFMALNSVRLLLIVQNVSVLALLNEGPNMTACIECFLFTLSFVVTLNATDVCTYGHS